MLPLWEIFIYYLYIFFLQIMSFLVSWIIFLLTWILLCIPLIFWSYIFLRFISLSNMRRYFVSWLIIWAITSFPLIFQDTFFLGNILENIFQALYWVDYISYMYQFFLLFWATILILAWLLWWIQSTKKIFFWRLLQFIMVFFLLLWSVIFFYFQLRYLQVLQNISGSEISFSSFIFSSFFGIIGYYITISFLEEGGKFLGHITRAWSIEYTRKLPEFLLLAVTIALWFSFVENILYTFIYVKQHGFHFSLLQIVFFRSLFSVLLHVFSSLLFAYGFWYIFHFFSSLSSKKVLFWWVIFGFIFLIFWVLSHFIFDLSLTLWYLGIVFLYVFFLYIFLVYLFEIFEKRYI